jgi:hypothetical protein
MMKRHKRAAESLSDFNAQDPKEPFVAQRKYPRKFFANYCLLTIFLVSIVLIVIRIGFGLIHYETEFNQVGVIAPDIILLYEKYDRNGDNIIDLNEFEPLAHKILSMKVIYF